MTKENCPCSVKTKAYSLKDLGNCSEEGDLSSLAKKAEPINSFLILCPAAVSDDAPNKLDAAPGCDFTGENHKNCGIFKELIEKRILACISG